MKVGRFFSGSLLTALGVASIVWACRTTETSTDVKDVQAADPALQNLKLTVTGNPKSGEVTVRFSYQGTAFPNGKQLALRYDVVSNGSGKVNCAKLKNRTTVTLEGNKNDGSFTFKMDPKKFLPPIGPHPTGEAKFDTTRDDAVWNGPMHIEGCAFDGRRFLVAAAEPVNYGFGLAGEDDIVAYGKICAEKLGPLPAFSCLDENLFKELPVTAGGDTNQVTQRVDQCDKPIYLPTGSHGNCKPWARLGRIQTGPKSWAAVVCRRYWPENSAAPNAAGAGAGLPASVDDDPNAETGADSWKRNPSGKDDPYFNDVAVIQHNTETGDTCFFQALGTLYVKRVPPPNEEALPETVAAEHGGKAKNAKSFWLTPGGTAGINCVNCHDADPWMHSPYARQPMVPDSDETWLKSAPKGKTYRMLGAEFGFGQWTTAYTVKPKDGSGDSCLSCHHIGSLNGCERWMTDVGSGAHFASSKTELGKAFPNSHWMPPNHGESQEDWEANYREAVDSIRKCCTVPGAQLGLASFFAATGRYGKKLTPAQITKLDQAGCKVTERTTAVNGGG